MTRTTARSPSARSLQQLVGPLVGLALLMPAVAGAGEPAAPGCATTFSGPRKPATHRAAGITKKAREWYQGAWGIDGLKVSRVASGNLIRFTYRVTEPAQAAPLVDRNTNPVLYAPRTRALLQVPAMEKVGPLRQTGTLRAGQEYWVAFSNKGNLVKPGDRVNVIVGRFHADGLVVE